VRRRLGSGSPEGYLNGSFNYHALLEALLRPLGPDGSRPFRRAVFDYRRNQPVPPVVEQGSANAVLILDGVFLLRPELRDYFDFSVLVRAGFDVTMKRAEVRDRKCSATDSGDALPRRCRRAQPTLRRRG